MSKSKALNPADFGVIFDCDGTLIDSMSRWHDVDYDLAQRVGVKVTKEDRDFMTQGTLEESADYIHEHFGIGADGADVKRMIMEDMLSYYQQESTLKPGALQLVEGLYKLGVPMAVASSTPHDLLVAGLEHTGIAKYMEIILSVDDVGAPKREPKIFDIARKSLGTSLENTWGVDDALYAIRTLISAGYPALGVYDNEIAGTPEQLEDASTIFLPTLEGFTAQKFLEMAKTSIS